MHGGDPMRDGGFPAIASNFTTAMIGGAMSATGGARRRLPGDRPLAELLAPVFLPERASVTMDDVLAELQQAVDDLATIVDSMEPPAG